MKKRIIPILSMLLLLLVTGCSGLKKAIDSDETVKINDVRATIVTTQGEINFYLYPEAAPITVTNFINLAKRGFYDNTKIHRSIENFMVQMGDPTGTGKGNAGYTLPEENVNWLEFFQPGMLAMANAGPGTGSSQFFVTTAPTEWLNGKHTVFGETISDEDLKNASKLEVGDSIKEIRFTGNVDFFLAMHAKQVEKWNEVLDTEYPHLKKYPVKPLSSFGNMPAQYAKENQEIFARAKENKKEVTLSPIPRFIRWIANGMGGNKKVVPNDDSEVITENENNDLSATQDGSDGEFVRPYAPE